MVTAWVKVFVHVPTRAMTRKTDGRHFESPQQAILTVVDRLRDRGLGVVGNYDNVTFTVLGESAYRPIAGSAATPTAGTAGHIHREQEAIIVFSAPKESLRALVQELKDNHPYETPVIDVFDLIRHDLDGLGP